MRGPGGKVARGEADSGPSPHPPTDVRPAVPQVTRDEIDRTPAGGIGLRSTRQDPPVRHLLPSPVDARSVGLIVITPGGTDDNRGTASQIGTRESTSHPVREAGRAAAVRGDTRDLPGGVLGVGMSKVGGGRAERRSASSVEGSPLASGASAGPRAAEGRSVTTRSGARVGLGCCSPPIGPDPQGGEPSRQALAASALPSQCVDVVGSLLPAQVRPLTRLRLRPPRQPGPVPGVRDDGEGGDELSRVSSSTWIRVDSSCEMAPCHASDVLLPVRTRTDAAHRAFG
jgi:hypothetical protein